MPSFGAVSFGGTAPSGYIQDSSKDETVEVATIRDANGHTAIAQAKPRKTTTIVVNTKGEADLVATDAGSFTSAVTESKVSETNDDFATASATLTILQ